jgi:hypothetical protein
MALRDIFKGVFSFLGSRSATEDRIAQYVIREHQRGRPLNEIVGDHYVTNRCTPEQVRRLLDRPEVLHALGEDTVTQTQTAL